MILIHYSLPANECLHFHVRLSKLLLYLLNLLNHTARGGLLKTGFSIYTLITVYRLMCVTLCHTQINAQDNFF